MIDRWRGRRMAGLAMIGLTMVAVSGARPSDQPSVVVRDDRGSELARVALPPSRQFTLSYRNSIYESLAEEHYRVANDGIRLVGLEAEELAVLEEYSNAYPAARDAPGANLAWSVAVDRAPISLPLRIRATELGRRVLSVGDTTVELWRLVAGRDDSVVILSIEPGA